MGMPRKRNRNSDAAKPLIYAREEPSQLTLASRPPPARQGRTLEADGIPFLSMWPYSLTYDWAACVCSAEHGRRLAEKLNPTRATDDIGC